MRMAIPDNLSLNSLTHGVRHAPSCAPYNQRCRSTKHECSTADPWDLQDWGCYASQGDYRLAEIRPRRLFRIVHEQHHEHPRHGRRVGVHGRASGRSGVRQDHARSGGGDGSLLCVLFLFRLSYGAQGGPRHGDGHAHRHQRSPYVPGHLHDHSAGSPRHGRSGAGLASWFGVVLRRGHRQNRRGVHGRVASARAAARGYARVGGRRVHHGHHDEQRGAKLHGALHRARQLLRHPAWIHRQAPHALRLAGGLGRHRVGHGDRLGFGVHDA